MATGVASASVAPTIDNLAQRQIFNAPVGSFGDTDAKIEIASLGITNPIPSNTLQGFGQGIYANITA
jgi:hypothetical protein